jgi:hypothetical protein
MLTFCGVCHSELTNGEAHTCVPRAQCSEELVITRRHTNQLTGEVKGVQITIARCVLAAGHVGAHHMQRHKQDEEAQTAT